jgi:hypothetical protein
MRRSVPERSPIVTWQDVNDHNVNEAIYELKTVRKNVPVRRGNILLGYSQYKEKVLFGFGPPLLFAGAEDLPGLGHLQQDLDYVTTPLITDPDRDQGVIYFWPKTKDFPSERAPMLTNVMIEVEQFSGLRLKWRSTLEDEIKRGIEKTKMKYTIWIKKI